MNTDTPFISLIINSKQSIVTRSALFQSEIEELLNEYPDEDIIFFRSIKNESYRLQRFSVRWLLRESLLRYRNLHQYALEKDENGKPFLLNKDMHISLSHNQKSVAIMVDQQPCGIDIELLKPRIQKVAHKFISPEEWTFAENDIAKQTLIWSAKETAYKALGKAGVLFKENLFCQIDVLDQKGKFPLIINLANHPPRRMEIFYECYNDEIITYGRLLEHLE